ncbi:serine hydrolase-like protein isoform X2 [Acipenser ruthenus]|uniref:serine hydrolase-like protein isoform X2 n=1 Tax=Acipenser ruthenus TaxID=7906 RepID=UPI002740EF72|nr:serine hydrolase-like protein isoform X2 [Acipenser ruthenus]
MFQLARRLSISSMGQKVTELRFPVPWGHIAAKSWGPREGRPVLCLHGWLDNANSFDRLIPLLPQECRCLAIDFPGHGLSSHRSPGAHYSFPAYVNDVLRVAKALEWKTFSILGHSMGGNVACLDEIPRLVRKGMEEMLGYESEARPGKVYPPEEACQRLLSANSSLCEESALILLQRGSTEVPGGLVFNRDFRLNLTNIARVTLEQSLQLQKRITASVLIVLAEEGIPKNAILNPDKLLQGFRDSLGESHFRLESVPGNHHVHLNQPEKVSPIVGRFLSSPAWSSSIESAAKL